MKELWINEESRNLGKILEEHTHEEHDTYSKDKEKENIA